MAQVITDEKQLAPSLDIKGNVGANKSESQNKENVLFLGSDG